MSVPAAPSGRRGCSITSRASARRSTSSLLLVAVVAFKAIFADIVLVDPLFGIYGIVVCAYIVSRFVFSTLYRPSEDHGLRPRVAIVMPAFNEEEAIAASLTSLLELDYPAELLEIVAVNDGSTDDTLAAHAARRRRRRRARARHRPRPQPRQARRDGRRHPRDRRRDHRLRRLRQRARARRDGEARPGLPRPAASARSAGTPTC